jgi:hypothetical protein
MQLYPNARSMEEYVKAVVLGSFVLLLCGSLFLYIPFGSESVLKWWFGLDSNRGLLWFSCASLLLGTIALFYLIGYTIWSMRGDFEVEMVSRLCTLVFQEALWAPLVYRGFERRLFAWGAFFLLVAVSINALLLLMTVLDAERDSGSSQPLLVISALTLFLHVTITDAIIWNSFLLKHIRRL